MNNDKLMTANKIKGALLTLKSAPFHDKSVFNT